jgi:hypothetical protein
MAACLESLSDELVLMISKEASYHCYPQFSLTKVGSLTNYRLSHFLTSAWSHIVSVVL